MNEDQFKPVILLDNNLSLFVHCLLKGESIEEQ